MKKKLFAFGMALCASTLFISNVDAATINDLKNWGPGTNIEVTEENSEYTLKLTGNAVQDLVIASGEKVTIDLNGQTFTSFCEACSTITILPNAEVTIMGEGTISRKNPNNNASTINNSGKLTIENGTIEAPSNSETSQHSAAISNENGATLIIKDGTIKTIANGAWGISNRGTAIITNGTFIQNADFSVIENSNKMTIINGTFMASEDGEHNSLLTNSTEDSQLLITGGEFNTEYTLTEKSKGSITIYGGTFTETESVENYLGEGYEYDENGTVVEKQEQEPEQKPEQEPVKKPENNSKNEAKPTQTSSSIKKDNEPKTGGGFSISLVAMIIVGALSGTYSFRKIKQ